MLYKLGLSNLSMTWKALAGAILLAAAPLASAAQPAADPSGDWTASLKLGAVSLRTALHLGAAASSFDSPDQGVRGLPARMTSEGRHVVVAIEKVGRFEGDLSTDGQTLTGRLGQGSVSYPLVFTRGSFAALHRPQTPVGPFPYRVEEIGYDNSAQPGVHLAGTLTVPNGAGPFPAVILITGSGGHDRDETLFEHKPFLVLADYLTRRGIAVLRLDDRGVGGSKAPTVKGTLADIASDVDAGVGWLRRRPDIDPRRIGLIGHSEGGIIAPMVASTEPSVAFIVLLEGPATRMAAVVSNQARAIKLAGGAPPTVAEGTGRLEAQILDALLANPDPKAAREAIDKVLANAHASPLNDAAFATMNSAVYRDLMGYDPRAALRKLRIPVLATYGSKDVQVTATQNVPAMRAALGSDPNAEIVELPGLNHLLQPATTGAVDEYGKIEITIDPTALKTIGDFVVSITSRSGS